MNLKENKTSFFNLKSENFHMRLMSKTDLDDNEEKEILKSRT